MESQLRAAERLLQEQASMLEELRRRQSALVEAVANVRRHHEDFQSTPVKRKDPLESDHRESPAKNNAGFKRMVGAVPKVKPVVQGPAVAVAEEKPLSEGGGFDIGRPRVAYPASPESPTEGSGTGTLDSVAMKVLAAAHERGYVLNDLADLPDEEWGNLGAAPSERSTILAALREWRRRQGSVSDTSEDSDRGAAGCPTDGIRDHLQGGIPHSDDNPNAKDDDFEDGIERGIGHGRRHFQPYDHIVAAGGSCTAIRDSPTVGGREQVVGAPEDHLHGAGALPLDEDDCYEGGLLRGIGHGRQQVPAAVGRLDHLRGGGAAVEASPGAGRICDEPFLGGAGGLKRGALGGHFVPLGRGKRYLGATDHLWGGGGEAAVVACEDPPGSHGHAFHKDVDFQDGMVRGIGHGRRHFVDKDVDHFAGGGGGCKAGESTPPGAHGHQKDDEFDDGGLPRGVGHGRRHLVSGVDALCPGETMPHVPPIGAPRTPERGRADEKGAVQRSPSAPAGGNSPARLDRPAGLPSRYALSPGLATAQADLVARLHPGRCWW
eukprot:TRINITY_DN77093_c0_g1_i1.p1 TRINITY_DN77093_c0_g1~~TRINITY_DN77093_c0_g1_i1.p1  ORF type:complete len:548 (-),score=96.84 TRINITY_DN77093_c0_g1_i1:161-1804(-)